MNDLETIRVLILVIPLSLVVLWYLSKEILDGDDRWYNWAPNWYVGLINLINKYSLRLAIVWLLLMIYIQLRFETFSWR